MPKTLYADITNITNPLGVVVSSSHSGSTSTAQIQCENKTVNIGDNITIDLGYVGDYNRVFKGYVKNISRQVPDDIYTVIAKDDMIRAIDYFIVPTNPDDSYKWHNISAENLIQNVLQLSGLTSFNMDASAFTFATKSGNDVEVKLASSYDFSKTITDLLAWHLWMDETGTVQFANRKPHVMDGTSMQVGDDVDETVSGYAFNYASPLDDNVILDVVYHESDRDLRNRVVVHGAEGIYAEALSATSYNPITDAMEQILPADFYKSMALISTIIDNQGMADKSVDYNLELYNRLTVNAQLQAEGDSTFLARKICEVDYSPLGLTGNWYCYLVEHQWSREGYVMNLELRK